jgi:hypothetical protein
VKQFVAMIMPAIFQLLAQNAKGSTGHRSQPLCTDLLLAADTDYKRSNFNPTKSRPDVSQQVRVAVEIAYGQLSLRSVLYFIQGICTLLYDDSIPIANDMFQLCLPALENVLNLFSSVSGNLCFSLWLAVDKLHCTRASSLQGWSHFVIEEYRSNQSANGSSTG